MNIVYRALYTRRSICKPFNLKLRFYEFARIKSTVSTIKLQIAPNQPHATSAAPGSPQPANNPVLNTLISQTRKSKKLKQRINQKIKHSSRAIESKNVIAGFFYKLGRLTVTNYILALVSNLRPTITIYTES